MSTIEQGPAVLLTDVRLFSICMYLVFAVKYQLQLSAILVSTLQTVYPLCISKPAQTLYYLIDWLYMDSSFHGL